MLFYAGSLCSPRTFGLGDKHSGITESYCPDDRALPTRTARHVPKLDILGFHAGMRQSHAAAGLDPHHGMTEPERLR